MLLSAPNLPSPSFPPSSPWPPLVQLQNNVFFSSHSWHILRIHSLCDKLFMHYTSFLNNLSSYLSIFPPLPPSVSASLSSASFKAFHLSTSPCLGIFLPIRHNSYLPLYIPSSLLSLSFFSIFLLASSLSVPSISPPSAEIKPRRREPGLATRTRKQTLKNKIKYIKTEIGSVLHGRCIFLDTISLFYALPALLHPVWLCVSLPPSVLLSLSLPFLSQTDIVAVLTVRRVCSD